MKKRITLIASLAIALGVCVIVGFAEMPIVNDDQKKIDTLVFEGQAVEDRTVEEETNINTTDDSLVINNPSQAQNAVETSTELDKVVSTIENTTETKNEVTEGEKTPENSNNVTTGKTENIKKFKDDAAVKAEIAKYIDTNVDFKNVKKEKIGNKSYDISFFEVDTILGQMRATYKNEQEDVFEYDINSGVLRYADIRSAVTEKNDSSIDKATAQKIAFSYAASNCDISEHPLDSAKETDKGYSFFYRRYIGKYRTPDVIVVEISYGGEIIYINNNTDFFADIDLTNVTIDEELVDSKIDDAKSKLKEDEYFYEDSVLITLEDGKLQLMFHTRNGCAIGIHYIPIEGNT